MRRFKFILLLFFFTVLFSQSPSVSAHSQVHIIKMTKDGFEPQDLTLDTSSSVIFVNQDDIERWPASNTHPTHEIYPEFDPKKPIEIGASWAFKPKRAGTFKFHDHLNPHIRGTLIVTPEAGSNTSTTTSSPSSLLNWLAQIKNWFTNLFHPQAKAVPDVEESWQQLKRTYAGQAGNLGNIHDQAHLIGGQLFDQKGFHGLSLCTADFAFGCYHGFLDKAFSKNLDDLDKAEKACEKLGNNGPFGSCIHGIGHGIASFYQTSDLDNSLKACQQLTKGSQFCFDGVFMEFERSAPESFYKKENPLKPCDELADQDMIFACGRNQPTALVDRFNLNFNDIVKVCQDAKNVHFKEACFDSLGFRSAQSKTAAGITSQCQQITDPEFMARCIKSGAGELIFQEVPGWQTEAPKACLFLIGSYQSDCQVYLDNLIRDYSRVDK